MYMTHELQLISAHSNGIAQRMAQHDQKHLDDFALYGRQTNKQLDRKFTQFTQPMMELPHRQNLGDVGGSVLFKLRYLSDNPQYFSIAVQNKRPRVSRNRKRSNFVSFNKKVGCCDIYYTTSCCSRRNSTFRDHSPLEVLEFADQRFFPPFCQFNCSNLFDLIDK